MVPSPCVCTSQWRPRTCGIGAPQVPPALPTRAASPAFSAPPMRRNPRPVGRGAPPPPQCRTLGQAQRGPRTGVGRGRGQAYNLTAEEAEASGEVVAGTILVYSVSVLSLFDSDASHYFISSRFTALHSIPLVCMGDQ